jgi:hypothetical protein
MSKLNLICITPIKNEAWILDRFLKCTSLWADQIIIADQMSTDRSREIAVRYPKVTLVENPSDKFDEAERQQLLIEAARCFSQPRLIIALDADEILTANYMDCTEWATICEAAPGTVISFQWANLLPDLKSYWSPPQDFPWGFMDDGSKHNGKKIHSHRVPIPTCSSRINLRDIKVLHYQYTHWERMESKHRWYQAWERLNRPSRHAVDIYRQYHHMYSIPKNEFHPVPEEWLLGYKQHGIDMTSICKEKTFWWDKDVLKLIIENDPKTFKREAIWDFDWGELNKRINHDIKQANLDDPRSVFDKYVHHWLSRTQPAHFRLRVRAVETILKSIGW